MTAPNDVIIMVLGNKCDLRETMEEGLLVKKSEIAEVEKKVSFVKCNEVSAKNDVNVIPSFDFLVSHCAQRKLHAEKYLSITTDNVFANGNGSGSDGADAGMGGMNPHQKEKERQQQQSKQNNAGCANMKSASEGSDQFANDE